jgi:hypothetical protein
VCSRQAGEIHDGHYADRDPPADGGDGGRREGLCGRQGGHNRHPDSGCRAQGEDVPVIGENADGYGEDDTGRDLSYRPSVLPCRHGTHQSEDGQGRGLKASRFREVKKVQDGRGDEQGTDDHLGRGQGLTTPVPGRTEPADRDEGAESDSCSGIEPSQGEHDDPQIGERTENARSQQRGRSRSVRRPPVYQDGRHNERHAQNGGDGDRRARSQPTAAECLDGQKDEADDSDGSTQNGYGQRDVVAWLDRRGIDWRRPGRGRSSRHRWLRRPYVGSSWPRLLAGVLLHTILLILLLLESVENLKGEAC